MARWREPDFARDLTRLLRHVRAHRGVPPPTEIEGDFTYHSGTGPSFLIQTEAMPLLRSLQRRLAGSSRTRHGMSPDEAGALLLAACDEAVSGTVKQAIANLQSKMEAPIETWRVAEPIGGLHIPVERLDVGRVTYWTRVPRSLATQKMLELARGQFVPPIAVVKVRARDQDTARILAGSLLAESAAVLDLLDRPRLGAGHVTLARRQDGSGTFSFSRHGWLINDGYVDQRGRLIPPYRQLSLAAARAEHGRSDWEGRVLAAARWYSRACRSEWPEDRLASLMVSLECLFVPGRAEKEKGAAIARRLTERFRLREMTEEEQVAWLAELYRARNDAVHEGREFLDDLKVDRLVDVTQFVIRRLAAHLVPAHSPRGRSCRTFAGAMRCSLRKQA